jgi:hypothetical protein
MGSSRTAERVATLVAAVSIGLVISGPAVAYADPDSHGRHHGRHSDSSNDAQSSGSSGDLPLATNSSGTNRTISPRHTRISLTGPFRGHTGKPSENARDHNRFRPPATNDGDASAPPALTDDGPPVDEQRGCDEGSSEGCTTPPVCGEGSSKRCPLPPNKGGSRYHPEPPRFHKPIVTFGWPAPPHVGLPTPPEAPTVVSSEPTAVPSEPAAEAPQIVAVAEPAVPAAVEIPPAAPALVEATASPVATLTSRVGTGATALTAVLVVLITGIWLYGNRLASHLTRKNDHA